MTRHTTLCLMSLSAEDVQLVRRWRNDSPMALRTSFPLTEAMQQEFYQTIICDQRAPHRYWAVTGRGDGVFYGMAGLAPIQWENGCGEISLVINPEVRGHGIGAASLYVVLAEAFRVLRLETVHGECYECNPAIDFWRSMVAEWRGTASTWVRRKFWQGRLWDSYLFAFTREDFEAVMAGDGA